MELSWGGLVLIVPGSVYPPAEDSFMLAEAAEGLRGCVLEIGCGCGIASLAAAKTAKGVLGVDVNPEAVACAESNARRNKIENASFIESDLFAAVSSVEPDKFDAILFNPPYLPTKKGERVSGRFNQAFDGGKDGRAVLDRFLAGFGRHLKPGGVLLLVQSSLNAPEKTEAKLLSVGYRPSIICRQDFFFEKLFLVKAEKPHL